MGRISKKDMDKRIVYVVRRLQKNGTVNARLVAFILGMDDRWNTVEMKMHKLAEEGRLTLVPSNESAFMGFR